MKQMHVARSIVHHAGCAGSQALCVVHLQCVEHGYVLTILIPPTYLQLSASPPTSSPTLIVGRMKNDPEFNIEFVRLVQKYPVLYNYTLTGHSIKPEVEKAWGEIGGMLNETGTACQEKWRILRGGFNRYIKKIEENPGLSHKKPYYLAKYMDFLLPFLKSRSHSGLMKSPNGSNCEIETPEEGERETIYDQCEVVYEGNEESEVIHKNEREYNEYREHPRKYDNERLWEGYSKRFYSDEPEIKRSRLSYQEKDQDSPDLMFMKSLLPDMALLNERNKMKFKIELLSSLNRLLYCENSIKQEDCNVNSDSKDY